MSFALRTGFDVLQLGARAAAAQPDPQVSPPISASDPSQASVTSMA
jgi:hypothetical protein